MERRGIPTVLFTATTFVHDADRSAASFGLPGLPLAVVPLPFTNQRPEDIHRMVDDAFDQVLAGLTRDVVAPERHEARPAAETLAYEGADLLAAWDAMNWDFLKRGWSDGFPLVAPTRAALDAMLKGTRRGPRDVIGTLEPRLVLAPVDA